MAGQDRSRSGERPGADRRAPGHAASPIGRSLLQDAAGDREGLLGRARSPTMGGRDRTSVRERLHELARKELLRPARRPSIEGESEYAFWHLLIRDVAYGQIPRAARADEALAAAASGSNGSAGERVADSAELLAYHYEQALELAGAAGRGRRPICRGSGRALPPAGRGTGRPAGRRRRPAAMPHTARWSSPGRATPIASGCCCSPASIPILGGRQGDLGIGLLARGFGRGPRHRQRPRRGGGPRPPLPDRVGSRRDELGRLELLGQALSILEESSPSREALERVDARGRLARDGRAAAPRRSRRSRARPPDRPRVRFRASTSPWCSRWRGHGPR